jgi:uncharacterized protein YcnI
LDIWARLRTQSRVVQRRIATWSLIPLGALSAALVLATPVAAHVTVVPPFVSAGDTASVSLTAPNERNEPMTGFEVAVPSEFLIVHAHPADGWDESTQGSTATWTGGSLAPGAEATFRLELEAPGAPGTNELEAVQRYSDGDVVTWAVELTVTPESGSSSQNLGWALVTALIGIAVVAAVGVTLLRRTRSLQER